MISSELIERKFGMLPQVKAGDRMVSADMFEVTIRPVEGLGKIELTILPKSGYADTELGYGDDIRWIDPRNFLALHVRAGEIIQAEANKDKRPFAYHLKMHRCLDGFEDWALDPKRGAGLFDWQYVEKEPLSEWECPKRVDRHRISQAVAVFYPAGMNLLSRKIHGSLIGLALRMQGFEPFSPKSFGL